VNADGRTDAVHQWSGGLITWISRGDGTWDKKGDSAWDGYDYTGGRWLPADVNADGRTDLVHQWSGGLITWISRGDGTWDKKGDSAWASYDYTGGRWFSGYPSMRKQEDSTPSPPYTTPSTPKPNPVATQLTKQTVRAPKRRMKKGGSVKLVATTDQGTVVRWRSRTKRICTISGPKLHGQRVGNCVVTAKAPALANLTSLSRSFRVRVR
jgi:hypothetical protein